MPIQLNINLILLGIAACNFLMAAVLVLLNNREKINLPVILLTLLLLEMSYTTGDNILYIIGLNELLFGLTECVFVIIFLIAPTLLLYIQSLTRPNFRLQWLHLLHFLPVFIYISINWNTYLYDFPANWEALRLHPLFKTHQFARSFAQVQLLFYILTCLWLIRKHNRVIEELMSSVENKDLRWMRDIMVATIVLFLAWIITDYSPIPRVTYSFITLLLTYWAGYKVAKQKEVFTEFSPKVVLDTIENVNETPQIRYKNSSLTDAAKNELMQKIEFFMLTQKPYRNNELTLPMLAELLGISTNNLSQILNEGFGENFYKFINRYRIEESQRLLLDPSFMHFNILGIAFEAGFNSKATFNKTFKEIVGISPSEFLKNYQNEEILQK